MVEPRLACGWSVFVLNEIEGVSETSAYLILTLPPEARTSRKRITKEIEKLVLFKRQRRNRSRTY